MLNEVILIQLFLKCRECLILTRKRKFEHYIVNRTLTKRYFNSAIPQMQRLLNSDKRKRVEILRKISSYPVNNDFYKSISLR